MANYIFGTNALPTQLQPGDTVRFNYTGSSQQWKPSTNGASKVKIECWGGAAPIKGLGGYASGIKTFSSTDIINVYCGGKGTKGSETTTGQGGWNGGGNPTNINSPYSYGGGGATDIRLNGTELTNRIIVAGGASVGTTTHFSHGGGLTGLGEDKSPGTQERGGENPNGTNGDLGVGGNGKEGTDGIYSAGGGGGYYGGAGSARTNSQSVDSYINGGGSSYIDGVTHGVTFDGSTSFGNNSDGYVIITILDPTANITINTIDKKEEYTVAEDLKFSITSNKTIAKIDVLIGNIKISTYDNPTNDTEYTIGINKELFLMANNGVNFLTWRCYNSSGIELYTHGEMFTKKVNSMTIITDPIEIGENECAVDLDLGFLLEKKSDANISVFAANNGFDENPTWVNVTDRVLNGLHFIMVNKEKTDEKWGISFKIIAEGYFILKEDIIGGFHLRSLPNTRMKNEEKENIYRNTKWGKNIIEKGIDESDEEIDIVELMLLLDKDLSETEFTPEYFKEKYNLGRLTEEQWQRLIDLGYVK